jgi:uncharacterized protein YegP (UPF0339 family)
MAKVTYYRDTAGEWRWRLVAANGNLIAESGEGYERLDGAVNGFEAVRTVAPEALVEVTDVD